MAKAVVLLSGGLDSTTCLAYALAQGHDCYALSFDYGQRHNVELEQAKKIAHNNKVEHHIFKLSLDSFKGSALTDNNLEVPAYKGDGEIPITYVPARNTVFLAIALGYAEVLAADYIYIGASEIDYSGYPDCRPEYFQSFQQTANLATKRGVEGNPISIEAPLLKLSKAQTIELGLELGVDYEQTISCYQANEQGQACGECDSCILRKKGFAAANITDPTRYINSKT